MTTLKFNIAYKTQWGEELCITGSTPQLGSLNEDEAMELFTSDGVHWIGKVQLQSVDNQPLQYYYFVRKNNETIRREVSPNRIIMLSDNSEFTINDYWKDEIYHTYLYSSVFTDCVFKKPLKANSAPRYDQSIVLNVICPYVNKNENVVITGEGDELGDWDLKRALPLSHIRYGEWQIELNAANFTSDTSYKFAIVDNSDLSKVHHEDGENRKLHIDNDIASQKGKKVSVEMGIPYRHASFQWKGKGVSIPLFSLRTEKSAGIGEFLDLKKMVDWAALTDQDMIQILPINDTNSTGKWTDSYPYNSISIFALNPIYISINGYTLQNSSKLKSFRKQAKELNKLADVDYEKVYSLKYDFLRELFSDEGEKVMQSDEYISFCKTN